MPGEQLVGMHYFDHQFLRADDFAAAQDYHVDRLRQHNALLHGPGVVNGLVVSVAGARRITIGIGRALDESGREVVLADTGAGQVPPLVRVQADGGFQESEAPFTGTSLLVDLAPLPVAASPVFVTIRLGTSTTTPAQDPGIQGDTRLVERAVIEASTSPPTGAQLLLAQLNRAADGNLAGSPVTTARKAAGATLADGAVTGAKLGNDAVTSAKLADADNAVAGGLVSQDTSSGSGVKTNHLQNNAVTAAKLAAHPTNDALRAVSRDHLQSDAVTEDKLERGVRGLLVGAYCAINGTTGVILNGQNVQSVQRLAVGQYAIRWQTPLNANGPFLCYAETPTGQALVRITNRNSQGIDLATTTVAGAQVDATVHVVAMR